jgi:hypothetical protein
LFTALLLHYSKSTADSSSQLNGGGLTGGQLLTGRFHNNAPSRSIINRLLGYIDGGGAAAPDYINGGGYPAPGYAPCGVVLWVVVALWRA